MIQKNRAGLTADDTGTLPQRKNVVYGKPKRGGKKR